MPEITDKPKIRTKKIKKSIDTESNQIVESESKPEDECKPQDESKPEDECKPQDESKPSAEEKPKSKPRTKKTKVDNSIDDKLADEPKQPAEEKPKPKPRAKKTKDEPKPKDESKQPSEEKPKPKSKPRAKNTKSDTVEIKKDEKDEEKNTDEKEEDKEEENVKIPENNIEVTILNENSESELVLNDHDEIVYSFHITNVHTNCTIQQLNDSLEILRLGEIFQISIHTKYDGPVSGKEKNKDSRQSEAYVYYKGTKFLIKKHPYLQKLLTGKKTALVHFLEGDTWSCELNVNKHYHFRTDEYLHKRIIIQSISTKKDSTDINWIFREHGEVEQVDMIWVKSDKNPTPSRCQSYIYFKEWGDEEYTYKLLEELNEVGVFTIKYGFKDYNDLLWIYELSPKNENSTEYEFEYGRYPHWIPKDDPKYGSRYDENNKLNWIFSDEGRFAYSRRIVDDEIKAHGGLFIGPEKKFYKIEYERKQPQYSWTTEDGNESEEAQKIKILIFKAVQKYLAENGIENLQM